MDDVLVVGAGPAGAVAATMLARAGVPVRLVDRATFPRDKLCGDTVNPGTLAELRRLNLAGPVEHLGLRVDGMRVTGPSGVTIEGRYPQGLYGRAIVRRELDWALIEQAVDAGVQFEPAVPVRRALIDGLGVARTVAGVAAGVNGLERILKARVTIAADGRRSTLAFALGLARHPAAPRRWAIGAYYHDVEGLTSLGEMHVRRGRYIGVAPVPGGLANVCLVRSFENGVGSRFQSPLEGGGPISAGQETTPDPVFARLLAEELARDPCLRDRFVRARLAGPPVVLGPLAIDPMDGQITGLLLAGDAAGFIDPMTGDGLRFAVRGGALAAAAALDALANGWSGVHARLAAARRREFGGKWRFNRALRATVASPAAVRSAALAARLLPGVLRRVISTAGDCGVAALQYR